MMSQPDYNANTTSIEVDPASLETLATTSIKNCAESFVGHINTVGGIWEGLALGWNGQTAEEAADFNGRWKATMIHLFGVKDDKNQPGIINQIAQVVYLAAGNYAGAEDAIAKSFQTMADSLNASGNQPSGPEDSDLPPIKIDY